MNAFICLVIFRYHILFIYLLDFLTLEYDIYFLNFSLESPYTLCFSSVYPLLITYIIFFFFSFSLIIDEQKCKEFVHDKTSGLFSFHDVIPLYRSWNTWKTLGNTSFEIPTKLFLICLFWSHMFLFSNSQCRNQCRNLFNLREKLTLIHKYFV